MFERASRIKLRFSTVLGALSVEDLWDLPLKGRGGNLDDIAIDLHNQIKDSETTSFVDDTRGPADELQLAFDIVKHIIDVKKAERDAENKKKENADKKQKILSILADKENEELRGKPADELRALAESL